MEPLSQRHCHSVFESLGFNAPIKMRRTLVPPKGVDEKSAMRYVRAETHFGGYISEENGRPPASFRAQARQWRKEGVLKVSGQEARELQRQGQKARAYYALLQRELEHFDGPFEWKYGHEGING